MSGMMGEEGGGSGQTSFQPLASRQRAIPPASCCLHRFNLLPVIHICGDVQGVQSEEGGEPAGGHDKGESFLKEHNLFSGSPRNWRSESQRLTKVSPRGLAAGGSPASSGVRGRKGRLLAEERVWRWSKETLPESCVTSGEFSTLSEEYFPWSGKRGDIYPIG